MWDSNCNGENVLWHMVEWLKCVCVEEFVTDEKLIEKKTT
jgi:trimethylamine:corrinoid methyltransferase-like protein